MTALPLLTSEQAAAQLGVVPETLRKWRRDGRGPAYIRDGGMIRYHPADIDAWVKSHRRVPTAA